MLFFLELNFEASFPREFLLHKDLWARVTFILTGIEDAIVKVSLQLLCNCLYFFGQLMTKRAVVASLKQQLNAIDGLDDDEGEVEAHPNDEHTDKDVAESEAAVDTGFNDTEVDHEEAEDV